MPGRFIETCSTINEKQLTSKNMQGWKRGVARTHSNIEDGTFCENSYRLKAVNFFRKVALSKMFDWVPNTLLFLISFIVVIYSKETSTQMFSCKISEIFTNTFFYRTPPAAASGLWKSVSFTFVSVLQNYHWKNLMMTVKDKNCIGFLH